MRSIHVEVRKAVIDGLVTAIADDDVSVTYGWQGSDDTRAREQIFTSNARAQHRSVVMNGTNRNPRREQMEFDLTVMVEGVGELPEDTESRAMELGTFVEEFIADNKSGEIFGIPGLNWIVVTGFGSDYRIASGAGSVAIATYTVAYDARLT